MKRVFSCIIRYSGAFMITFFVLALSLVGASKLPQEPIQIHMQESADIYQGTPELYNALDFAKGSRIDHYSDSLWMMIGYYWNGENVWEKVALSSYYDDPGEKTFHDFQEAVTSSPEPNHEYIRYWHGPAAAMRLLHLFWNIKSIYVFHYVMMAVLFAILLLQLIIRRYYGEAVGLTVSLVAVSVWLVPVCLEYSYMFLCMLMASNIAVGLADHKHYSRIGIFFLVVGMVAAFFDFLTTETLTLLVPLLLILRIRQRQWNPSVRSEWLLVIKSCVAWLIGFVGMWMMKWVLASVVLQQNVMPFVVGHIEERIGHNVTGLEISGNMYIDTLLLNFKKLFPLEYGYSGAVLVLGAVFIFFVVPTISGKVSMRNEIRWCQIGLYLLLGLVPYVRYFVLYNHSYIHSFFTYRAQAATVLAICFIILELVEPTKRKQVINHGT